MVKRWKVMYRQFARGRRSLKVIQISAATRAEAIDIFWGAVKFNRLEDPLRFNNVKLIAVFEEVGSHG